jgi:aminoglycoside phosphotransferase (APT) family kinase protein
LTLDDRPARMSESTTEMQTPYVQSAITAAVSCALDLGLNANDAVVLQASNRIAVRLLPCDVVSRVAPVAYRASAEFEVEVARRLGEAGSPVAALEPRVEPRVYVRDGFVMNMWTYYEPASRPGVAPAEYAQALERLHAGMREIRVATPHFTDRVAEALRLVDNPAYSPDLENADRELLSNALRTLSDAIAQRRQAEQLLHGEPHRGNLLKSKDGLRFIDFETCCRGPIEFDLAHAPEEVSQHYPGVNHDLLRECRMLMLAMVASWRWDRDDQFPDGRRMGRELISQLRAELGH